MKVISTRTNPSNPPPLPESAKPDKQEILIKSLKDILISLTDIISNMDKDKTVSMDAIVSAMEKISDKKIDVNISKDNRLLNYECSIIERDDDGRIKRWEIRER